MTFFISPCTTISYTSFLRPTAVSRFNEYPRTKGAVQKARPARPQGLWRAERTAVREHDKGPRTPLADFFNSPSLKGLK